jgi:hypothetical protein
MATGSITPHSDTGATSVRAHRILGIVGVVLLIGAGAASAQTVGGGAKFGMNFATITGDAGWHPAAARTP